MCGIAGRFHPIALEPLDSWHGYAAGLLAHRGPDGRGHYRDARCELVQQRLMLQDLTDTGRQPLANEDGTVHVVFNGEIYNHQELRAELQQRGHVFRGTSDTEVLVHLYEEQPHNFVERLRGMFAFAIYDRARARVLLARDRFGIKPLFFTIDRGELIFASEIKAILTRPGVRRIVDRQACYDFLSLGYIPEPATGFAGIHALTKGHVLVIDARRPFTREYARVRAHPDTERALDPTATETMSALLDAVALQRQADVEVGALLSGGIDSSTVVAASARLSAEPLATFNVRFPDELYDETSSALAVAAHCGSRHTVIDVEAPALSNDSIIALLLHFDQPFADPSLIPTYWVMRAIRDHGFKCVLSGDGGDEAFGGYANFGRISDLRHLMRLPSVVLQTVSRVGDSFAEFTRDSARQLAKASRLADAGTADPAVLLAGLWSYVEEGQKQQLVTPGMREGLLPVSRHFAGAAAPHSVEGLSRLMTDDLFAIVLPSQMLRKVDMMSSLASMEVRLPLLDERLVDIGLSLPHALKVDGSLGKRVLRRVATQWLPPQTVRRRKQGFGIPLDVMVPSGFYDMLEDLLLARDARTARVFEPALMRRWLGLFRNARHEDVSGPISRAGLSQRVLMALALELWLRQHEMEWN
jgi:asparagine synthase (glutamine-hydrolysing)